MGSRPALVAATIVAAMVTITACTPSTPTTDPAGSAEPVTVRIDGPFVIEAAGRQTQERLVTGPDGVLLAIGRDDAVAPTAFDLESGFSDIALWRSADDGATWQAVVSPVFAGIDGRSFVSDVAITDDQIVVAGNTVGPEDTLGQIWVGSADATEWRAIEVGRNEGDTIHWLEAMTTRPPREIVAVSSETTPGGQRLVVHRLVDDTIERVETIDNDLPEEFAVTGLEPRGSQMALQVVDVVDDERRTFVSIENLTGWVRLDTGDARFGDVVTATGTRLAGFGPIRRSDDGSASYDDIALPTDPDTVARAGQTIVDGDRVFAVGSITSAQGSALAVWASDDDARSFELVHLDAAEPGRPIRVNASEVVGDTMVIAGTIGDGDAADAAFWRIDVVG